MDLSDRATTIGLGITLTIVTAIAGAVWWFLQPGVTMVGVGEVPRRSSDSRDPWQASPPGPGPGLERPEATRQDLRTEDRSQPAAPGAEASDRAVRPISLDYLLRVVAVDEHEQPVPGASLELEAAPLDGRLRRAYAGDHEAVYGLEQTYDEVFERVRDSFLAGEGDRITDAEGAARLRLPRAIPFLLTIRRSDAGLRVRASVLPPDHKASSTLRVVLPRFATLRGVARDQHGQAVGDVVVVAVADRSGAIDDPGPDVQLASDAPVGRSTTGAAGTFCLEVPEGSWLVGLDPRVARPLELVARPARVNLVAGEEKQGVLRVGRGLYIGGQVLGVDESPVFGIPVTASCAPEQVGIAVLSGGTAVALTDGNGIFKIGPLGPGVYSVAAVSGAMRDTAEVEGVLAGTSDLVFRVTGRAELGLRIVDRASGAPVHASIVLDEGGQGLRFSSPLSVFARDEPTVLEHLDPGTYDIVARAGRLIGQAREVNLVDGARAEVPTIELVPVGALEVSLQGIRTDSELVLRHLATDFLVRRALPRPRFRTTTRFQQVFELPAGPTRITIERAGREITAHVVDVGTTPTLELNLRR